MSFTITTAFVQQFGANVMFLAQQKGSRLRRAVYEEKITGETAYLDAIGKVEAQKVVSRHADSPLTNTPHERRRVAPYDYEFGDLIDREDKVRMLIDPESAYAQAAGWALGRGTDDEIVNAFFATAYTGKDGSVAAPWPAGPGGSYAAGTQVAVNDWSFGNGSGNSGLTISKLISAQVALQASEADEDEESFIAVTSKQLGNLLSTTEATSKDYNSVATLVSGQINTFMGFTFIRTERLQTDGSGYTRVPVWKKSGMGLGVGMDPTFRVAERPDKRFSVYVYASMALGAARLEEAKIVEIKCA